MAKTVRGFRVVGVGSERNGEEKERLGGMGRRTGAEDVAGTAMAVGTRLCLRRTRVLLLLLLLLLLDISTQLPRGTIKRETRRTFSVRIIIIVVGFYATPSSCFISPPIILALALSSHGN